MQLDGGPGVSGAVCTRSRHVGICSSNADLQLELPGRGSIRGSAELVVDRKMANWRAETWVILASGDRIAIMRLTTVVEVR